MSYRIRYELWVDWVGPGMGPTSGALAAQVGPGSAGGAQTQAFFNQAGGQNINGSGAGGILASADITTLLASMSTDLSAKMNAALPTLTLFASGGPPT